MKNKILLTLIPALALGFAAPVMANETSAKIQAGVADVKGDAAKAALKQLDAEIEQVDDMIDNAPTSADKSAAKARLEVLKERRSELRKTYVQARYDELKADVRAEANKAGAWTKRTFTRDPGEKAADEVRDAAKDARRDARRAGDEAADEARDAARDANRAARRAGDDMNDAARDANREVRRAGDNAYAHVGAAGASMDLAAYKSRPTDTNREEAKAAIKALEQKIDELDDRADKMPRGAERDAAKRRVKALEDRKDEIEKQFHKARFDALIDDVQAEWNDVRN
jgi:colicin import membrane protein